MYILCTCCIIHIFGQNVIYKVGEKQRQETNATGDGRFDPEIYQKVTSVWDTKSSLPPPFGKETLSRANGIPWGICYHNQSEQVAQKLLKDFDTYNVTRKWNTGCQPLQSPKMIKVNYSDLNSVRNKVRGSKCKVMAMIIPDEAIGSKLKTDITRFVFSQKVPSHSLSAGFVSSSHEQEEKKANDEKIELDLQFICEDTVNKGEMNVFESILIKANTIPYYIDPKLPSNKFDYNRLWMIGIKILKTTAGANLFVLSCNRTPMIGTITNTHTYIHARTHTHTHTHMYMYTHTHTIGLQ